MPIPVEQRLWAKVDKSENCWNWMAALNNWGYAVMHVDKRGRPKRVSRIVWELEHGPIPTGLVVMHKCDNPRCVRPDHLALGTQADNLADMRAKGRANLTDRPRGEEHHRAKLTDEKVRVIRARLTAGESLSAIARSYQVDVSTIHVIASGKGWRHVV